MTKPKPEVIPGIELEVGKKVLLCTECGKAGNSKHLKRSVVSTRHTHQTAHKVQKQVKVKVIFINVQKSHIPMLCIHCQTSAINGMNGGMFE